MIKKTLGLIQGKRKLTPNVMIGLELEDMEQESLFVGQYG